MQVTNLLHGRHLTDYLYFVEIIARDNGLGGHTGASRFISLNYENITRPDLNLKRTMINMAQLLEDKSNERRK